MQDGHPTYRVYYAGEEIELRESSGSRPTSPFGWEAVGSCAPKTTLDLDHSAMVVQRADAENRPALFVAEMPGSFSRPVTFRISATPSGPKIRWKLDISDVDRCTLGADPAHYVHELFARCAQIALATGLARFAPECANMLKTGPQNGNDETVQTGLQCMNLATGLRLTMRNLTFLPVAEGHHAPRQPAGELPYLPDDSRFYVRSPSIEKEQNLWRIFRRSDATKRHVFSEDAGTHPRPYSWVTSVLHEVRNLLQVFLSRRRPQGELRRAAAGTVRELCALEVARGCAVSQGERLSILVSAICLLPQAFSVVVQALASPHRTDQMRISEVLDVLHNADLSRNWVDIAKPGKLRGLENESLHKKAEGHEQRRRSTTMRYGDWEGTPVYELAVGPPYQLHKIAYSTDKERHNEGKLRSVGTNLTHEEGPQKESDQPATEEKKPQEPSLNVHCLALRAEDYDTTHLSIITRVPTVLRAGKWRSIQPTPAESQRSPMKLCRWRIKLEGCDSKALFTGQAEITFELRGKVPLCKIVIEKVARALERIKGVFVKCVLILPGKDDSYPQYRARSIDPFFPPHLSMTLRFDHSSLETGDPRRRLEVMQNTPWSDVNRAQFAAPYMVYPQNRTLTEPDRDIPLSITLYHQVWRAGEGHTDGAGWRREEHRVLSRDLRLHIPAQSVFISYHRPYAPLARLLASVFDNRGIKSIVDEQDLLSGQKWRDEIDRHITNCDRFAFLLVPEILHTWDDRVEIRREILKALEVAKAKCAHLSDFFDIHAFCEKGEDINPLNEKIVTHLPQEVTDLNFKWFQLPSLLRNS